MRRGPIVFDTASIPAKTTKNRSSSSPSRTTTVPGGSSSRSIRFASRKSTSPGSPDRRPQRVSSCEVALLLGTLVGVAVRRVGLTVRRVAHRLLFLLAAGLRLLLLFLGRARVVVHVVSSSLR